MRRGRVPFNNSAPQGRDSRVPYHPPTHPRPTQPPQVEFVEVAHGREASGFLHFMNVDAIAVVQGPKMQQTNRGYKGRHWFSLKIGLCEKWAPIRQISCLSVF